MEDQRSSLTACKDFVPNRVSYIPRLHSSAFASLEGLGQEARFDFFHAGSVILIYHLGLRFVCQEGFLAIQSNTLLNWKNQSYGRLLTVFWVVHDSYLGLNGVYL